MTTIAEDMLPILYDLRGLSGEFGMRPHSVSLLAVEWSGAHSGDGDRSEWEVKILETGQNPRVKWPSDETVVAGDLEAGTVLIGPITPDHGSVKRLYKLRSDDLQTGDARYLRITGPKHPNGALYVIKRLTTETPLSYYIEASPVERLTQ